jgi:L,D-peptidoglycan transpeptidase YkuD (ErfK/YbiS/YcfS/YnhG family)
MSRTCAPFAIAQAGNPLKKHVSAIFVRRTGFLRDGRLLHAARLTFGMFSLSCRIGRTGVTHAKREGDGATPAGTLRVVRGFWRADRRLPPRTGLPLRPIRGGDGWCEVPGDRNYNRLVKKPYVASHEDMMREDPLYDVVLELDWNHRPRRQGRGSAIFFHLTRENLGPTAGCIAVPANRVDILLAMITRKTRFIVR